MEEKKITLSCGFGKKEITPPMGFPMVGYYTARFAKGVLDPLFVRAAMFEIQGVKTIVMTLDICLITKDLSTAIRESIAKTLSIPIDAIFLSLSHTHTGPLTGKDFASDTVADPAYLEFLKEKALEAALDAAADLAPSKIFYAKTEAKGISFVRRYRMKDGSVRTNPTPLDPAIDHPLGEPNEDLRLLKIQREGAKDLYIVNFGTHADTVKGDLISADWPGYVCSILESAIPDSACMLLVGPQGDVNHLNPFKTGYGILGSGITHARFMGRVIAGQILGVCDCAKELSADQIRFKAAEIRLPTNRDSTRLEEAKKVCEAYYAAYESGTAQTSTRISGYTMSVPEARRIVRMQNEPDFYPYSIYAIRLGDFVFAGLPGEPFSEIGRRIYQSSPFENMMLSCLTNASCGYVGTSAAYDEGGYETLTSSYKRGVDDVMVDGMRALLEELK